MGGGLCLEQRLTMLNPPHPQMHAVVDNLPVIPPEKVDKLLTVLRKIYTSDKIGGEIREGECASARCGRAMPTTGRLIHRRG